MDRDESDARRAYIRDWAEVIFSISAYREDALSRNHRPFAWPWVPGVLLRLTPWIYGLSLATWAASFNLRYSVLMSWSPVSPVWLCVGMIGLCVVHRLGKPVRMSPLALWPLVLLMVGFLPGALHSSNYGYGPTKLVIMLFVVVPVVIATMLLLDTPEARRAWACSQIVLGVAVSVAALAFNDVARISQVGRFTLATVDTVSSGRLVGAAVVVLFLICFVDLPQAWWALPLTILTGGVLLRIGSRGPLLSALLAVALVLVVGRYLAGRRVVLLPAFGAVAVAATWYAQSDAGAGGSRILASAQSGFSDSARSTLRRDAIDLGMTNPWGIGWGDFADHSKLGNQIANAEGVAYAHNMFAEAFAEGGVVALVGLVVAVSVALARQWSVSGFRVETLSLGVAAYWLLNAQASSDLAGNRAMWIALAAGWMATQVRLGPSR